MDLTAEYLSPEVKESSLLSQNLIPAALSGQKMAWTLHRPVGSDRQCVEANPLNVCGSGCGCDAIVRLLSIESSNDGRVINRIETGSCRIR